MRLRMDLDESRVRPNGPWRTTSIATSKASKAASQRDVRLGGWLLAARCVALLERGRQRVETQGRRSGQQATHSTSQPVKQVKSTSGKKPEEQGCAVKTCMGSLWRHYR
eukprot:scaffold1528_cov198-Pinguiococcus_pyrenoidosus.AAC.11